MNLFHRMLEWFRPVPAPIERKRPLPEFMIRHFEAQDRGDFGL